MSFTPRTYVCFDADNDIVYYRLMQAWDKNENFDFKFDNAHELNQIRKTSSEATIKRALRERLKLSDVLVVLIGESTKNLYVYVRWEIEIALEMGLPIIAVNLNSKRKLDTERCPPILRDEIALHIPYSAKIMKKALQGWISQHHEEKRKNMSGPYSYGEQVFVSLGC